MTRADRVRAAGPFGQRMGRKFLAPSMLDSPWAPGVERALFHGGPATRRHGINMAGVGILVTARKGRTGTVCPLAGIDLGAL